MSIFLGDQLTDVFEQIKEKGAATRSLEAGMMDLGVSLLPNLPRHSGDRNRTSPIAFTGNKFEYRAVGSSQTISWPQTIWNTILSDSLDFIAGELEGGADVMNVIQGIMQEHGRVIFNGDGYTDEWHKHAEEERGLANLRTTADALPVVGSPEVVEVFSKFDVMSEQETHSRLEVFTEQYVMSIEVEANLVLKLGRTVIFPAAVRYASELADSAELLGIENTTATRIAKLAGTLQSELDALEAAVEHVHDPAACRDTILPKMLDVRAAVDALELLVADDLWPLPSYQEMLFIR